MEPVDHRQTGYELRFTQIEVVDTYDVTITRWQAGASTTIAEDTEYVLPPGSSFALADDDSTVSAWTAVGGAYGHGTDRPLLEVRGALRREGSSRPQAGSRWLGVGSARMSVPSGASRRVVMRLSKRGRQILRTVRGIEARGSATIKTTDGTVARIRQTGRIRGHLRSGEG